jgi:glycosyltransferase involved in cell wall biosynthesis
VDLLLDAAAGLRGEWSLLVVGRGSLRERLAARIEQEPFAGRATLLDSVPHAEMPRYLNAMDVLVLPSREAPHWKEQFGHVLVEAMACEVAAVGSTCGEIPHVLGDAGLVFPEDDAGALRSALQRLLDAPDERADLARRGRQRVLAHYTDARVAQATHEIWREVMSG